MKQLPTLIWDIDDVLNHLMHDWLEQAWKPTHPDVRISYAELTSNPPHEVLGVSREAYLASLDAFRASPQGRDLTPVPEMLGWFSQHGHRYRHLALTARPLASAPDAAEWVLRHFGRWIRGFGFVPSFRPDEHLPNYHTTKADWLQWISVGDFLIDDSPANFANMQGLSLRTVMIPQPWNSASGSLADALKILASI